MRLSFRFLSFLLRFHVLTIQVIIMKLCIPVIRCTEKDIGSYHPVNADEAVGKSWYLSHILTVLTTQ